MARKKKEYRARQRKEREHFAAKKSSPTNRARPIGVGLTHYAPPFSAEPIQFAIRQFEAAAMAAPRPAPIAVRFLPREYGTVDPDTGMRRVIEVIELLGEPGVV